MVATAIPSSLVCDCPTHPPLPILCNRLTSLTSMLLATTSASYAFITSPSSPLIHPHPVAHSTPVFVAFPCILASYVDFLTPPFCLSLPHPLCSLDFRFRAGHGNFLGSHCYQSFNHCVIVTSLTLISSVPGPVLGVDQTAKNYRVYERR